MPIQVTCPGCMSRFSVSEKYAGKKGPCPKCKKEITIPDKSQEVVIHAPEAEGPKDTTGKLILKPIRREYTKISTPVLVAAIVGGLAALVIAIVLRGTGNPSPWILAAGAVLLAPPLIVAGYGVLRDGELEGYYGKDLWIRTLICTAVFASTWGIYNLLSWYFENPSLSDTSTIQMGIFMVAMIAIGTVTSLATFELEVGQAVLHYFFYFVVTFMLAMIIGLELGEPLKRADKPSTKAKVTRPVAPGTAPASPATEGESAEAKADPTSVEK